LADWLFEFLVIAGSLLVFTLYLLAWLLWIPAGAEEMHRELMSEMSRRHADRASERRYEHE
jgi:hypothetical protein